MKIIFYVTLGVVIISICLGVVFNVVPIILFFWNLINWIIFLLIPLIWGILIAYLLEPIQERIEKKLNFIAMPKIRIPLLMRRKKKKSKKQGQQATTNLKRGISTTVALIIVLAIVGGCVYGFFVTVRITSTDIISNRAIIEERVLQELDNFLGDLEEGILSFENKEDIRRQVFQLGDYLKEQLAGLVRYFPDTFNQIITVCINLFFAFIFAFNLVLSKEYFTGLLKSFLKHTTSKRIEKVILDLGSDINHVIKRYIIGYTLDLTLISLTTSAALWVAGFPYPFIIGIFAGLTNVVPYFGTWLGALPIVFVTILDEGIRFAIFGYFYIIIVQQLYYSFITPRIQGEFVGVHPLFVLLAFIVFSKIFGLPGMILAVPLAGIVGVIVDRVINFWKVLRLKNKKTY